MALYGKANYDKNAAFAKVLYYQLKSKPTPITSLVLRIGPPIKEAAEKGVWATFVKSHFGYKLKVNKTDGGTLDIPQTFICTEKTDRNKNVLQECPECNERSLREEKLKREQKRLEAEGKTKEEIAISTKYQAQWLKDHNLDMKWNMLAKAQDGKWGLLRISNKLKKKLDEKIKEMVAKNIDPLDPERGLWFHFKRTDPDNWQDPGDIVDVFMEEDAEGNLKRKFDSFTQADDEQLDKLPELYTIGKRLSIEQIRLLVESGGDEEVVKSVFGASQPRTRPDGEESPAASEPVEEPSPRAQAPAPTPEPETKAVAPPAEDDEEAKLMAALEAARAKKAAAAASDAAKKQQQQVQAPGNPSPNLKQQLAQDMDSFIAMFETK